MRNEQTLLRTSIVVTLGLAAFGVVIGLVARSSAIIFDGVYAVIDAAMTGLALLVARLIAASNAADATGRNYSQRFTMGFWHLEPIVLGVNGMLLTGAAIYAAIESLGVILRGGREPEFGLAIIYAALTALVGAGMAVWVRRRNRDIRSELLALDVRAWIMTTALSVALFTAFVGGIAVRGTHYAWLTPYIDPAALLLVCVVIIPIPFKTIRQALSEILLVTPPTLKARVDGVAEEVAAQYGFLSYHAFVAQVGRGVQIELNFVVPREWPAKRLEEWDAIRDEIGVRLGGDGPDLWLTIVFTTDPEWAW